VIAYHFHDGPPRCVDLLETFGADYQITYDPAYDSYKIHRHTLDRWMMQLPCKYGVIYPYGDDLLAIELTGIQRSLWTRLEDLGCRLYQQGDRERTYLFPVALWQEVFTVVRPKRRRKATGRQLEVLLAHGKVNAFRPGHAAVKGDLKRRLTPSEPKSDPTPV
jgi:hypothetical protein